MGIEVLGQNLNPSQRRTRCSLLPQVYASRHQHLYDLISLITDADIGGRKTEEMEAVENYKFHSSSDLICTTSHTQHDYINMRSIYSFWYYKEELM